MYLIKSLPKGKKRGLSRQEIEKTAYIVLRAVNNNDIDLMLDLKYKTPISFYTWGKGLGNYEYCCYMKEPGYETWLESRHKPITLDCGNLRIELPLSAYAIRTLFKRLGIEVEEVS